MTIVLALAQNGAPGISYELPEVAPKRTRTSMEIVVKDMNGKEKLRRPLAIINPLSNLAYEALDNKINSTYAKIGARLAIKYVAAIAAAYGTYQTALNAGSPAFLAKVAATGTFAVAHKGIVSSETADLRYWSSLPHDTRMTSFHLPPGEYQFFIRKLKGSSWIKLGTKKIKSKNPKLYNFRI